MVLTKLVYSEAISGGPCRQLLVFSVFALGQWERVANEVCCVLSIAEDLIAWWESEIDGELGVDAMPNADGEVEGFGYLSAS